MKFIFFATYSLKPAVEYGEVQSSLWSVINVEPPIRNIDMSPIHCILLHFTINYIDNFYTVEITNKTSWNKSFRFEFCLSCYLCEQCVAQVLLVRSSLVGGWVLEADICSVLTSTLYRELPICYMFQTSAIVDPQNGSAKNSREFISFPNSDFKWTLWVLLQTNFSKYYFVYVAGP